MKARSAGLLLYRRGPEGLEVLLVHPGGPFWVKRDAGAWSIPKGEIGSDEEPLDAARREFVEELGSAPSGGGALIPLAPVKQAGGKVVIAWAQEAGFEPTHLRSNTFELEWPPRSGRKRTFPEVDRAGWFTLEEARRKLLAGQLPLLAELVERATTGG